MVPQEKQNSIETTQTKEVAKENHSPKEKLKKIFETSTLKPETIENLKRILTLVDINELNDFIISEPDLDDIINQGKEVDLSLGIKGIIDNFLMNFGESKISASSQESLKKSGNTAKGSMDYRSELKTNIVVTEETEKKKKEAFETLKNRKEDFKKIFGENSKFFQLFEEYKDDELKKELIKFLSNQDKAKDFFQTLNEKNPALYKETYNAIITISPELQSNFTAWGIPSEPYEVEKLDTKKFDDKTLISQFPGAKGEDIEKRGNLVSYNGKTIDLKTGKAYISGEGGYAIETSMSVPNSLDVRAKYLAERLEIIDEIKTNEKILNLLNHKKELKQQQERLQSLKSTQGQSAQDLQIDIEITQVEKELQKIDEKLKVIIPGYKEEQDEAFSAFLKEKIEEGKDKLTSLKEQFDADLKKLLGAGKDTIMKRDENVKKTIEFLDDLGLTNINQNDLQKIINRVNIIPQAFGFSKRIDLKAGFEGTPTDALQQKKELFKLFSKLYEKMDFTPPVNESIITGFPKDERLKNDTIFKQKLEDLNLTKGGSIQIETMMSLLGEKTQERERKYPGKPNQKATRQKIPVETK